MLPFRLVYDEDYDLELGDHVFPGHKYRLIRERLLARGIATPADFIAPLPPAEDTLRLVHSERWLHRLFSGSLSYQEVARLEIPYSRSMVNAVRLAVGGTILASRLALADGIGFNLGGGFHHAFADHGEGFCPLNDVAVAIRLLLQEGAIQRAMVVDCDVHHGNGTAAIFAGDPRVFTFSIHQFNNYPAVKPPSDVDVHLEDGVGDEDYLDQLLSHYVPALGRHNPQLVVYLAGADPYYQDELGGLALTMSGLRQRDRLVIETALRRGASVAVTLAGGYAFLLQDTVTIHTNTVKAALEAYQAVRGHPSSS